MKRYLKPGTVLPTKAPQDQKALELGADFDVLELLAKSGEILKREISNLMIESSGKKLSATSAKDLVAYVKLLHELKTEQESLLKELSDEQLEGLTNE